MAQSGPFSGLPPGCDDGNRRFVSTNPSDPSAPVLCVDYRPYVDLGGGGVWTLPERDLPAFDQAINSNPGGSGKFGVGVVVGPGPLLIEVGLDAYLDHLSPGLVVNTLAPGSLAVEGTMSAIGIAPRLGVSGEVVPGTLWSLGAGGGIAFQSVELRTAGGPVVLSGTGTTLMGHADFGLRQEVAPGVFLGGEVYANFYDGFDVRTSTNAVSRLAPTIDTGIRVTLRAMLGDR
jgi:hypothetical protein